MKYSAYYVVSTGPNRERLANNGKFYSGSLGHGQGPKDVKEFKSLGWAKRAAQRASQDNVWVGDIVVIGLLPDECLMRDGLVFSRDENLEWQNRGYGRQVALVVKENLMISLFG